jgi:hypothetical protein
MHSEIAEIVSSTPSFAVSPISEAQCTDSKGEVRDFAVEFIGSLSRSSPATKNPKFFLYGSLSIS